ncbi:MAG: hypothetical protein M3512_05950 [Bacteroidota bacterium]|nr:hypothetical protein [Bacteroidota bacterium]
MKIKSPLVNIYRKGSLTIQLLKIVMIIIFSSCQISENKVEPEVTFNMIYNENNFQGNYDPLDIRQTSDSGYLILSARDKWSISILKTDKWGAVEKLTHLEAPYANALPLILEKDTSYYFFCMNELSLHTYLMKINKETWQPEVDKVYNDITYPLATSMVPENAVLLQSYDRVGRNTQLSKLDGNFNIVWKKTYPILEDQEEPIISHLTRIGKRLPFFTGYLGDPSKANTYFLNGYYNFSMSMLFVSINTGELKGVVNGYQDKGAISAAIMTSGNNMALSRYSFEDNFLLPRQEINTSAINFSGDLKGTQLPELSLNAPVHIKKLTVAGKEILIYATETKSNQIVLYTYDAASGNLLGTRYWGNQYPYKVASFTATADGGLAIVGKTYVAGKFPRIYLIKISAAEFSRMAN